MRNPWKITTLVLALALAVSLGLPLISSADAHKIRQPHMEAALMATRTAKQQLKKATADKGGHRVKAIAHIKAAEEEILKGIEVGGRHEH